MHYYYYNMYDDYCSFSTLIECISEAKKEGYGKVRDNHGGEYWF